MDDITFVPALAYRDPKAALDWLTRAFDFELTMAIDGPDDDPTQCHYEMGYDGRGRIMIGGEWNEWMRSPASIGGTNTTSTHVEVVQRHRRALRAGPRRRRRGSWSSPPTSSTATASYRCADPEGHHWTFAMHVRDVTRSEAEAAIGQPITRHELGSDAAPAALRATLDLTLAALADPVRRRSVELLAERPRRAGELAAELGVSPPGDEPSPAGAPRPPISSSEEHPPFDARVRIYSLRAGADDRAQGVARRRRGGLGPAARRVQGPRGATR